MNRRKIDEVLIELDEKDPGCLDVLSDTEISKILVEKKILLPPIRIERFRVKRDNTMQSLSDGTSTNKGKNKLKGFDYTIRFV